MDKPMNKDGVTDAMIERGCHAAGPFVSEADVKAIYLAMLRASPPVSTDGLVERVRDAIWREDHYSPELCSHGDYGGDSCAYCERHDDDTPVDWPADKERAERQAKAAIKATGIEQLTSTLSDRDATIAGLRLAMESALAHRYGVWTDTLRAALDASATGMVK